MEKRLQKLEIMVMHHDEIIERLSNELHKQQNENRLLQEKLEILDAKIKSIKLSNIASETEETSPPHY